MLQLLLLMTSIVVDPAAGGCDFDHRWSYEARPCSGWLLHKDDESGGRFALLTGSRVSNDNLTRSLLPLVDHSEGTETGAMMLLLVYYSLCRLTSSERTRYTT